MSDEKVLVKPAEGRVVPHPFTRRPIPPEGKVVTLDSFWRRRLRDGDVTIEEAPKKTTKKESK